MLTQPLLKPIRLALVILIGMLILSASTLPPANLTGRVRAYTRQIEFDFTGWVLEAMGVKLAHAALGSERYLAAQPRHDLVIDYLETVLNIQQAEWQLKEIYTDPNITDPQAASVEVRNELSKLKAQRDQVAPTAEAILQSQIGSVAAELGLTLAGQPIPPVLYHSTSLPWALIISPRDIIRQDADISLTPDLEVDQHAALEDRVDQGLDVSSLVVGIGGIGLYPTMVAQTSNLNWMSEIVAHEWIHNFLTLRPLGMSYLDSPELRTMNETTAAIAGKEIGRAVLERYYPELAPPPAPPQPEDTAPTKTEPPAFDFVKEMRETRVTADQLLSEGKIEEAEAYMEMQRRVFWENGYHIRKLNQAYFAFFGAYADQPGGGAAGADPVGAAVRQLRQQSPTLAAFLKKIAWMNSFEDLKQAIEK